MAKKIAFISVFSALAIIISALEGFVVLPIPGAKLGIANMIVVITMYYFSYKEAFWINMIRILVLGFMFGGVSPIIYSLSGGLISFVAMVITKNMKIFSVIGVSVVGGFFHNITQVLLASFVIKNIKLLYYMPILMLIGIFSGTLIGIMSYKVLEKTRPELLEDI